MMMKIIVSDQYSDLNDPVPAAASHAQILENVALTSPGVTQQLVVREERGDGVHPHASQDRSGKKK